MLKTLYLRGFYRPTAVKKITACGFSKIGFNKPSNDMKKPFEEAVKANSDTFGNYHEITSKFDAVKDDPEDIKERLRQRAMDRRSPAFYIDAIKSHLSNHNFEKALSVLEDRMLMVDKVKPDSYVYDLLISYCGRTGNVKEAFRLYNQIKKRGYYVTGGQYTSLFNACANSRDSKLALNVTQKVRTSLSADKLHKANIKNYNSMLKAFGRHGDLKSSLEVMDEVLERRKRVRDDTYNFLLQACITDTNSGFRHALLVWHRLLLNKTDPSTISFNLMLRATRDCSFGDPQLVENAIENIMAEARVRGLRNITLTDTSPVSLPAPNNIQLEEPNAVDSARQMQVNALDNIDCASLRDEEKHVFPNLLAVVPKMGSVIQLASFTTAYHRLMLLGGALGFLQTMDSVNIKPDMKTFTLLLEIIPSSEEAENDLISVVKAKKVPFDAAFFNVLIKKRSFRKDYTSAKGALTLMQSHGVAPDLITFGVLALTCRKREDGEHLIASVRAAGFRVNSQILGPLVRQAVYQSDVQYVRSVLAAMKEDMVQPSPKLMLLLNTFMESQKKIMRDNK